MNTEPLIWMLIIQIGVIAATVYFFSKVIKADKKEH